MSMVLALPPKGRDGRVHEGDTLPDCSSPQAASPTEPTWLRDERQRFEACLETHFARLRHEYDQFTAWRAEAEASLQARAQEQDRQAGTIADVPADYGPEIADQLSMVTQLREEAQRLRQQCRQARDDLHRIEEVTRQKRQIKDELERRQHALERAEQTLQQRLAETAEMEQRIRNELDLQQLQMVREKRELEVRREKALHDSREIDTLRRKLCEVTHEMRKQRRLLLGH
jgi:hypothetical protein